MFAALLDKLSLGAATSHRELSLTPILALDGPLMSLAAKSLEEALADGSLRVSEVSDAGHVPELRVRNVGETPVLIVDGEELVGAKQNRVVNVTILVPPWSEIVIPVTCVEAGRWTYSRPTFVAAGHVLNPGLRRSKAEHVTSSLKANASRFSDQRAMWGELEATLDCAGSNSPTRSFSDAFDRRSDAIDDYRAAFAAQPGQIGVICRIGGELVGLDLFGCESSFSRSFDKLVRGAALEASYRSERAPAGGRDDKDFLAATLSAPGARFAAVGLGEEIRIDSDEIGGAALVRDGGLVHLFAFPRSTNANSDERGHQL